MAIAPDEMLSFASKTLSTKSIVPADSWTTESKSHNVKVKEVISSFYLKHPIKNLVSNEAADSLAIKRFLENTNYNWEALYLCINYMQHLRKPELRYLAQFVNESIQFFGYKSLINVENSPPNLVEYFYKQIWSSRIYSPNFIKECVMIEHNLDQMTPEQVKGTFKLMFVKKLNDLRLFNYIRNDFLTGNTNSTQLFKSDDELADLLRDESY